MIGQNCFLSDHKRMIFSSGTPVLNGNYAWTSLLDFNSAVESSEHLLCKCKFKFHLDSNSYFQHKHFLILPLNLQVRKKVCCHP